MYNRKLMRRLLLGAFCMTLALGTTACNTDKEKTTEAQTQAEESTEATTVDPALADGWHEDEKGTYYILDGKRQTGFVDLTEHVAENKEGTILATTYIYAFDEEGYLYPTGWLEKDGETYYVRDNGCLQQSIVEIDGVHYVFTSDGKLTSGMRYEILQDYSGLFYYEKTGRIYSTWKLFGGEKFYFGEDGAALSGWQTIDGKKYYFGNDESSKITAPYAMATGKRTIDGVEYDFGEDGVLVE
ncbi:MAG: hypothetical protein IJ468_09985 [Lachnospiraceae bacterium]|nr:hypothetical protein [Lachnospiraceae bacterium]